MFYFINEKNEIERVPFFEHLLLAIYHAKGVYTSTQPVYPPPHPILSSFYGTGNGDICFLSMPEKQRLLGKGETFSFPKSP